MSSLKKFLFAQSVVLLLGMTFAWYKLLGQFSNFYHLYGTIFRIQNCAVPNPFTTACFYGSTAFVVALVWSLVLIQIPGLVGQRRLRNFLAFCVVFAGSVVLFEAGQYYKWFAPKVSISCSPGVNPFLTPCFYGLLFFAAAFGISIFTTRRLKFTN